MRIGTKNARAPFSVRAAVSGTARHAKRGQSSFQIGLICVPKMMSVKDLDARA
jgi:hypothetical protein